MIRRLPCFATLLSLAFFACSTADREQVAGGDDMGNFVRAILLDSAGAPLAGRVQILSDVDTVSLQLDAGGRFVLPSRHRAWISMRRADGPEFLLDSPSDSGDLGAFRVADRRPLVGWLGRVATLTIPGVGSASSAAGLFRFAAVPPGRIRLVASSDSFRVWTPLSTVLPASGAARRDTLVLAPMTVASGTLVALPRSDTGACGAGCPSWLWTSANVSTDSVTFAPRDTFKLLWADTLHLPDTTVVAGVDSVVVAANWLLVRLRMRGDNAPGVLVGGPSGTARELVFGAGTSVDTTKLGDQDSVRTVRVAIPRVAGAQMADALRIHGWSATIPSAADAATADTCAPAQIGSGLLRCANAYGAWILSR